MSALAPTDADDIREDSRSPSRQQVLVVEDDALIASMLTDELKELGYAVVGPARNVTEAAAIAATSALDGALVDVELNGESALPVAKILSDRHIPFVFTTGDTERPEGASDEVPMLVKPFTVDELRRALQHLVRNPE